MAKQINQIEELKGKRGKRELLLDKNTLDEASRTIEFSASSEAPILMWYGCYEILKHDPSAVRMERITNKAPLLWRHDPDDQIGVIEEATLDAEKKQIRVKVRFSKSECGERYWQDVLDGIITKVSIGYDYISMHTEGMIDNIDVMIVDEWMPDEVSLVSIAADDNVGIGREKIQIKHNQRKDLDMDPKEIERLQAEAAENAVKGEREQNAANMERINQIMDIAEKYPELDYKKAIREKKTVIEVQQMVIDGMREAKREPVTKVDLTEKETKIYDIGKALRMQVVPNAEDCGFEREVHLALLDKVEKMGVRTHGGILIPFEVQSRRAQRDASTMTIAGNAGGLNNLDYRPETFIELLYNAQALPKLGTTVLNNLVGTVFIPKQTAGTAVGWVGEGDSIPKTDGAYVQVPFNNKTVAAYVEMTRDSITNSLPGVQQLLTGDLTKKLALAVDLAGIRGTGANGQPLGIIGTSGVSVVEGADFTIKQAGKHITNILEANLDLTTIQWLIASGLFVDLSTQPVGDHIPSFMIQNGKLLGQNAMPTNQLAANSLISGDFSQLVQGNWGVVELLVDPYTSQNGNKKIFAFYSTNFMVRRPTAFSRSINVVPTSLTV